MKAFVNIDVFNISNILYNSTSLTLSYSTDYYTLTDIPIFFTVDCKIIESIALVEHLILENFVDKKCLYNITKECLFLEHGQPYLLTMDRIIHEKNNYTYINYSITKI